MERPGGPRGDDDDLRLALRAALEALPAETRRDLLKVLTSRSAVRADVIRQVLEREGHQPLGELLIDLEQEDLARYAVISLLRELTQHWPLAGPECGRPIPHRPYLDGPDPTGRH